MGVFFEQRRPDPTITNLLTQAYESPAPDPTHAPQLAAKMAGDFHPFVASLTTALSTPPAGNAPALAGQAAQQVTNQLLGGAAFNTGRFAIAFLIFGGLVGGGISCEATHLTTASGTLFGFAGAIFGIVTAFLGTESANAS